MRLDGRRLGMPIDYLRHRTALGNTDGVPTAVTHWCGPIVSLMQSYAFPRVAKPPKPTQHICDVAYVCGAWVTERRGGGAGGASLAPPARPLRQASVRPPH